MSNSGRTEIEITPTGSWKSRNVIVLGIVSFLTDIHSEMILALLPQFMKNVLGMSTGLIGLVEGLADATASLLKILSGWWSDKIGRRKPVVLAGYGLSTAVKPLLAIAQTAGHVLAVRVGDRIGKGIRSSARDALVAESVASDQRGRAFGFHRAMDTAGAVLGTALAMVCLKVFNGDYRQVFLWATVGGVGAVIVLAIGVKEKRRFNSVELKNNNKAQVNSASGITEKERKKSFYLFLGAHLIFSAANFSYAFFLLRAQDVGVKETLVPGLYLIFNIIYALSAFPAGMLLDHLGPRCAQVASYLTHVLACLTFAFFAQPYLLIFWFAIYGISQGAVGACSRATVAGLIDPERRGTQMGLFTGCEGVGLLIGSVIGGQIWQRTNSGEWAFIWGATMAGLAALMTIFALRCQERST